MKKGRPQSKKLFGGLPEGPPTLLKRTLLELNRLSAFATLKLIFVLVPFWP
jgi:hypothetical protein